MVEKKSMLIASFDEIIKIDRAWLVFFSQDKFRFFVQQTFKTTNFLSLMLKYNSPMIFLKVLEI